MIMFRWRRLVLHVVVLNRAFTQEQEFHFKRLKFRFSPLFHDANTMLPGFPGEEQMRH
jgi:hypothetical protein